MLRHLVAFLVVLIGGFALVTALAGVGSAVMMVVGAFLGIAIGSAILWVIG